MDKSLDGRYTEDSVYKYACSSGYVLGFRGITDIIYFKTREDAIQFVKQNPNKRQLLC